MTIEDKPSPQKWAFRITHVLNHVLGLNHFPIDVKGVALDYSKKTSPGDPILNIKGASLPGFEAGLFKAPPGKQGWGILYNSDITSLGRINFTLAHELGHYLQHRIDFPDGIQCGEQDLYRWDSEYRQIEYQANLFAANLLMPLDDYRKQISPSTKLTYDLIRTVAERYGVSLLAALLRWIEYTEQRAVLVVTRSDYILWTRSSTKAFSSGAFIKTSGLRPKSVPLSSLASSASQVSDSDAKLGIKHKPGIWFGEYCEEFAIRSEQYDFVLSLVLLGRTPDCPYEQIRVL